MPLSDEDLAKELLRAGLVSMDVVQQAATRRTAQKNLAAVLIESRVVSEEDIRKIDPTFSGVVASAAPPRQATAAPQAKASVIDLAQIQIDVDAAMLLPRDKAASLNVIPIRRESNRLTVAMADPRNLPAIDEITKLTGLRVEAVAASPQQISQAINRVYTMTSVRDVSEGTPSPSPHSLAGQEYATQIGELIDQAPAVKVANMLLDEAVIQGASDIHIEPRTDFLYVRFRVDGILRTQTQLERQWEQAVLSRFKVLANLDLAESRFPQDGRFRQTVANRVIDFRVSTIPTYHGEKIVLRLLDKSTLVSMDKLGFRPDMLNIFEELVMKPQGMILVTGPTGSGKSTTLYAALNRCRSETKNVITVEDPIEYQMEGINQTQINPKIDLTFAAQLRAILRQDPDVILVGEIRDKETADMAFRAALTGHLVLSTLHTNDAPSTVTRLLDMGMESYLIASSIIAVLAQRLLRTVCPKCKEPTTPDEFDLARLGLSTQEAKRMQFFKGRGCDNCNQSGYRGRCGIYELLVMHEPVRQKIAETATASDVRLTAIRNGMQTMKQDGLAKVQMGVTTIDELARVLYTSVEDEMIQATPMEPDLNLSLEEAQS